MSRSGPGFPLWAFVGFWMGMLIGFWMGYLVTFTTDRQDFLFFASFMAGGCAAGGAVVGVSGMSSPTSTAASRRHLAQRRIIRTRPSGIRRRPRLSGDDPANLAFSFTSEGFLSDPGSIAKLAGEYRTGVRLTKARMKPSEDRLERSKSLPKYDITIRPREITGG